MRLKKSKNRSLSASKIDAGYIPKKTNFKNESYFNSTELENNNNNNRSKYETGEIEFIQLQIQNISTVIAKEKITLMIQKERFEKKVNEYNLLAGKPIAKSHEQKQKEIEENIRKLKKRKIEDLKEVKKKVIYPDEENKIIQKNTHKCEIDLEFITKEINQKVLSNKQLKRELKEMRAEKLRMDKKLNHITEQNSQIQINLDDLIKKNEEKINKIQFDELEKTKKYGVLMDSQFLIKRDSLELQYHKVIEDNIRHEQNEKKELSRKRLMFARLADEARNKKTQKTYNTLTNSNSNNVSNNIRETTSSMKALSELFNDKLSDRVPILEVLVKKWKTLIKLKKNMVDRYINNSIEIKHAFDKILSLLGVDRYKDLPEIFQKVESHLNTIEKYKLQLFDKIETLKEKKKLLEIQIERLSNKKNCEILDNDNIIEEKKEIVNKIRNLNEDLITNINSKRKLFENIEAKTLQFLKKMQNSYLHDFVEQKIHIDDDSKLNETNIIECLGSIYCYCQIIIDFNQFIFNKENKANNIDYAKNSSDINKNIDNLKTNIKNTLNKFSSENFVNNELVNSIKNDINSGLYYDETIKRLANVLADQANQSTENFSGRNSNQTELNNKSLENSNKK